MLLGICFYQVFAKRRVRNNKGVGERKGENMKSRKEERKISRIVYTTDFPLGRHAPINHLTMLS